jgi:uncharacterized protein (TIGR02646 family)
VIRINKPATPPAILTGRGKAARAALEAAHEGGKRDFAESDFDKTIYGPKAVKDALRRAQHDKCAFCESSVSHVSYGDVEHYRPKAAVAQKEGDRYDQPGYYWLAYEWANLFFCCQLCNQRFKRNLFPLRNPKQRARSHRGRLTREKPLLLDPSDTEPTDHVTFHGELAVPVGGSLEGQTTIEVMGLNRTELLAKRRVHLELLDDLRAALNAFRDRQQMTSTLTPVEQAALQRLETRVHTHVSPHAEYSSMTRALFS